MVAGHITETPLENIDEYAIENLSTELDRLEGQDLNQETIDNVTSLIKDIYLDAAEKSSILK